LASCWVLSAFLGLLATPASAALFQVDWVTEPIPGQPGTFSGSLGVFDLSYVGQSYVLPADGSLTAISSDWIDGYPNQSWSFIEQRDPGNLLSLEVVSLLPLQVRVSGGTLAGPLTGAADCPLTGDCRIWLARHGNADAGRVYWVTDTGGVISPVAFGGREVLFVLNAVPEPGTAALLALGCVSLAARRRLS